MEGKNREELWFEQDTATPNAPHTFLSNILLSD